MNIQNLQFRLEEHDDYRTVEELTREAFWNHHSPGCDEHYLVHIMRDADSFIKELDIVALIDEKIIANIMYTKAKIVGDDGKKHEVISFGPVSVLPEFQGKGIGSMLIEYSKKIARKLGYTAILIYGDPDYYSRVGFAKAETYGIGSADNMYAAALQGFELIEGALSDCKGLFFEDNIYHIDAALAQEFDKKFLKKELQNNLPSQERFCQVVQMRKPRI